MVKNLGEVAEDKNVDLHQLSQELINDIILISNGSYKTSQELYKDFDSVSFKQKYLERLRENVMKVRYIHFLRKFDNVSDLKQFYENFLIKWEILKLDYSKLTNWPMWDIKDEIIHIMIIEWMKFIESKIRFWKLSFIASRINDILEVNKELTWSKFISVNEIFRTWKIKYWLS